MFWIIRLFIINNVELTCVAGVPNVLPKADVWAPNPVVGWGAVVPKRLGWAAEIQIKTSLFVFRQKSTSQKRF